MLVFFFWTVWYLGRSFRKNKTTKKQSPTLKVMAEILLRVKGSAPPFQKKNSSGQLIFPPDAGLLLISSQEPKVTPPAHISWETIREYSELQLKNSFLLWSQMFLQEAGEKMPESNWWKPVKIQPCCGWYHHPGPSQNPEGVLGCGSQHRPNWISVSAAGSCRPAPRTSWAYCWKYQTCFVHYQELKNDLQKGRKGSLQPVSLPFKQMSSSSRIHHVGAWPWGPYPSSLPMKISPENHSP